MPTDMKSLAVSHARSRSSMTAASAASASSCAAAKRSRPSPPARARMAARYAKKARTRARCSGRAAASENARPSCGRPAQGVLRGRAGQAAARWLAVPCLLPSGSYHLEPTLWPLLDASLHGIQKQLLVALAGVSPRHFCPGSRQRRRRCRRAAQAIAQL